MKNNMFLKPIATTNQKSEIKALIPLLIDKVINGISEEDLSLTGGVCGQLIFLNTCKNANPSWISNDAYDHVINLLFKHASSYPFDSSLAKGLAGLGWTLDCIGFSDENDFNSDVNECLLEILKPPIWKGEFEFLYGLAGIGVYGACRIDKPHGREIAEKVLHHLIALATTSPEGTYWETKPSSHFFREDIPSPQLNLGAAHGNCSILGFLIKLAENNIATDIVLPLLQALCNWLVAQQLDPEIAGGYFPAFAGKTKTSRMGWCYGDLTTSLLLLRAAQVLDDEPLHVLGCDVAKLSTKRNEENGAVVDSGLCHGSGGISVIYQHIARYTDAPEITEAAQQWLQITLNRAALKPDLSGLLQNIDDIPKERIANYKVGDFLMGHAGIGLSLLAAISEEPVNWGSSLMLS